VDDRNFAVWQESRTTAQWVYTLGDGKAEGHAGMKNLLSGKGPNLAEMSNLGLPVPPGFTITAEVCTYHYDHGHSYPEELKSQVENALTHVGKKTRPNIKLGICGENGSDPASIHFCQEASLDYVSCSPYCVPLVRRTAAQAALGNKVASPSLNGPILQPTVLERDGFGQAACQCYEIMCHQFNQLQLI
jgi:phosphoenolpyruvate synthase/pyruvate phosphate dikinase